MHLQPSEKSIPAAGTQLHLVLQPVGEDISILLYGGEKPHIGCTVMAVPRPSLKGDGSVSCTSSVLNLTGHKDEAICRYAAEKICAAYNAVTVCAGGFHIDDIRPEQISEVRNAVEILISEVIRS